MFFSVQDRRHFIPRHHRVVREPHPHFPDFAIPTLWLFDRAGSPDDPLPYQPIADFCLSNSADSITTLLKPVRALGFAYDFEVELGQKFARMASGARVDFAALYNDTFVSALLHGTQNLTFDDEPDNLLWRAGCSPAALRGLMSGLDRYFAYLNDEGREGQARAAVSWLPNFSSMFLKGTVERSRVSGYSFLEHLRTLKRKEAGQRTRRASGRGIIPKERKPRAIGKIGKRFPTHLLCPMLEIGFSSLRKTDQNSAVIDQTGQLAAAVAFGGIRGSESLHMWVNDLQVHSKGLFGFLRHPQHFKEANGQSREDVLAKYDLIPRNLQTGRFAAGFKHPALNEQNWALIKWLPIPGFQKFLTALLVKYLVEVRGPAMARRRREGFPDHPYLLVTTRNVPSRGVIIGDPYTTAAMRDSWRRAISRLQRAFPKEEIVHGKRFGTTRHAVRHAYGKAFDELGATPKQIQLFMHHVSVFSSLVYREPTEEEAHAEFEEGAMKMRNGNENSDPNSFIGSFDAMHDQYSSNWANYD